MMCTKNYLSAEGRCSASEQQHSAFARENYLACGSPSQEKFSSFQKKIRSKRLGVSHRLGFVADGGGPHAETEGTLVDEIGKVVDNVQDGHGQSGENTGRLVEVAEVCNGETDGVDAPSDGNDHLQGVEGGLGSLTLRGDLGSVSSGFAGKNAVADVQPS